MGNPVAKFSRNNGLLVVATEQLAKLGGAGARIKQIKYVTTVCCENDTEGRQIMSFSLHAIVRVCGHCRVSCVSARLCMQ